MWIKLVLPPSGFRVRIQVRRNKLKTLNFQTQDQAISKTGTEGRRVHRETTTETGQVQVRSESDKQIMKR